MSTRFLPVMALLVSMTGCTDDSTSYGPLDTGEPGRLASHDAIMRRVNEQPLIVEQAIEATGGVAGWQGIRQVDGDVMLTLRDGEGPAYVNTFAFRMELAPDRSAAMLSARAETPDGTMHINVARYGAVLMPPYLADRALQMRVAHAMQLLLHRFAGPWNFMRPLADATVTGPQNIAGVKCIRVAAMGDVRRGAYYFDAAVPQLRFITENADTPGQEGTITIYEAWASDGRRRWPQGLRVNRVGQYVLIGEENLLEAQFANVRFVTTIK